MLPCAQHCSRRRLTLAFLEVEPYPCLLGDTLLQPCLSDLPDPLLRGSKSDCPGEMGLIMMDQAVPLAGPLPVLNCLNPSFCPCLRWGLLAESDPAVG